MSDPNPAESAPLYKRLSDFSTRLSPVLVKELRQGMRTNLFVIAFILLQTFMILCMLAGLANPRSNDSNGFFWFFIITTMLVIQPLRGFNALSSEYQLNTMDLIQLTRLNGWRITLGKWTALNAQGLLFLIGVLPYLVIRYFIGNVNIVYDLAAIGSIGLGSALGTAITIGCSVFRSIIVRGIILVGLGALFITALNVFALFIFGRYGSSPQPVTGALTVVSAIYGIFFFLSFGASRIAPLSENQSTRKRLLAIGFALLCQVFYFFNQDTEVLVCTGIILGLATIDALTEPLPIFSRVLTPFRRSPLHRVAALFLCPGWISGIGFFILCATLWMGSFLLCNALTGTSNLDDIESITIFLSSCNLIIFPLLIQHLFFAKHSSSNFTFGLYMFIQAGLFGLTLMVVAIANALRNWEELVYLIVPIPAVFIAAGMDGEADTEPYLIVAGITFLLSILFPLVRQYQSTKDFFRALFR